MNVVGHNHKITNVVRITIAGKDLTPHDRLAIELGQLAFPHAPIEKVLHLAVEMLVILKLIRGREAGDRFSNLSQFGIETWNTGGNPTTTLIVPRSRDVDRNGVA